MGIPCLVVPMRQDVQEFNRQIHARINSGLDITTAQKQLLC